jgi:hypothetical protein
MKGITMAPHEFDLIVTGITVVFIFAVIFGAYRKYIRIGKDDVEEMDIVSPYPPEVLDERLGEIHCFYDANGYAIEYLTRDQAAEIALRSGFPRLYADNWYEVSRIELAEWAAHQGMLQANFMWEMRTEMGYVT